MRSMWTDRTRSCFYHWHWTDWCIQCPNRDHFWVWWLVCNRDRWSRMDSSFDCHCCPLWLTCRPCHASVFDQRIQTIDFVHYQVVARLLAAKWPNLLFSGSAAMSRWRKEFAWRSRRPGSWRATVECRACRWSPTVAFAGCCIFRRMIFLFHIYQILEFRF